VARRHCFHDHLGEHVLIFETHHVQQVQQRLGLGDIHHDLALGTAVDQRIEGLAHIVE
jgi:hypothetical protein